jgi:hypothetical protein
MMDFVRSLSSPAGRVLRALLGVAMIVLGAVLGGGWYVLAVVGLLPLAAGVFDFCLIAPLLHRPMASNKLRANPTQT